VISQTLCAHLEAATDRNEIRFLVALHMAALRVAIEEWLEREDNTECHKDLISILSQRLVLQRQLS
jgi:hypothetical protein